MKKTAGIVTAVLLYLTMRESTVFAHLPGQPPFFKVNDEYSVFYSVTGTSLSDFTLPQDMTLQSYPVGESIHFEIDKGQLPVPQEIVAKTKFMWDFGDKTSGEGLINDHVYTKPGSYIVLIYADTSAFEKGVEKQLIQSVILNVVTSKTYSLPQSHMEVNGKSVSNPITDWLTFKPGTTLTFDASKSKAISQIISYFWDFGDGTSGTGKTVTHTYKDQVLVFPLLRIQTEEGFIADSSVEIHNDENEVPSTVQSKTNSIEEQKDWTNGLTKKLFFGAALILCLLFIIFVLKKRGESTKKNLKK